MKYLLENTKEKLTSLHLYLFHLIGSSFTFSPQKIPYNTSLGDKSPKEPNRLEITSRTFW
jgi:hypothetical protein